MSLPERRDRPPRGAALDGVLGALLYVGTAAWFLWLAAGASSQGVLSGEEASVSRRDPLALALHWQPSVWSTNVASQVFFGVTGNLGGGDLLGGRPWKAVATALLAPLVFVVARRRCGCARLPAVVAAVLVSVLPGVASMAWVALETPLDCVAGVAALLVVTSRRRWWPVGLVLAGLAVSLYTAGLGWALAVLVVAIVRSRSRADAVAGAAGLVAGVALVLAPLLWWRNGGVVVTGGGRDGLAPGRLLAHLGELGRYTIESGASYYYSSGLPVLGGPVPAAVLLVTAGVAVGTRCRTTWPWLLAGLACLGLYAVSSGVPGARRVVAVSVVAALLAGVGLDVLSRTGRAGLGRRAALAVLILVVVGGPATVGMATWRESVVHGERRFRGDWGLVVDPGETQASTLDRLGRALRSGTLTVRQVGDGWGGTRTLALLYLADARHGRTPPLGPDDLLAYYATSGDCRALDGPPTCAGDVPAADGG